MNLTVKETTKPSLAPDSDDQIEYKYLKGLYDRIFGDLDEAAHYMGLGTPSYACTHQEVLDKLSARVFELEPS